jgi:hypothetical protein
MGLDINTHAEAAVERGFWTSLEGSLPISRRRLTDTDHCRYVIVKRASSPVPGVWTFFAAELANIKPGVEAWIAAQRLNRLAQVL